MKKTAVKRNQFSVDFLTVIALSMLAYTLAVLLHEYAGHAVVCASLGGRLNELGAFYIDCQYGAMSDTGIRLVALSGPLASFLSGLLGLALLRRLPQEASQARYLAWLFASINLMLAAGYLLFSGFSGLGDFGLTRDGVFFQMEPAWLWQVLLSLAGVFAYGLALRISLIRIDDVIGGKGEERVRWAQKLAQTSYLTGGMVSILVGLLNPHGIIIVLMSSVALSLGGTSGLVWMMQLLDRKKSTRLPALHLERNMAWITGSVIFTLLYAIILGPTIMP